MSQGKIVLMACGSFSPPTYMHLRMFEIARDYIHSLGLGTIIGGIVSPVHDSYGKKDLVAAHHRIAMLKLALRSSGWIKVSEWETQQAGWTRTRLSLQYHQDAINASVVNAAAPAWLPDDILNVNDVDADDEGAQRGGGGGVTVRLLCGADLLESFATPGLWADEDIEAIVGRHGLVVVSRAGSDPGRFIYESDMLYKYRRNVTLVTNYVVNDVSSTVIRRLLRRNESAKYLTDDGVVGYIRQHRLYGATPPLTEYTPYSDVITPDSDVTMASPDETTFKNILISIRDKPSIVDETVTVKRPKRSYLGPLTDSVGPTLGPVRPKLAYQDKVPPTYVPGKAVKITSDGKHIAGKEKVSFNEAPCRQPDSLPHDVEYELYRRRVSDSVRKLRGEELRKSRSEVSKLCDKVKSIKLKDRDGKNYKTRSCNDIVKLILTKHGIHVISDTEAIV